MPAAFRNTPAPCKNSSKASVPRPWQGGRDRGKGRAGLRAGVAAQHRGEGVHPLDASRFIGVRQNSAQWALVRQVGPEVRYRALTDLPSPDCCPTAGGVPERFTQLQKLKNRSWVPSFQEFE